MSKEAMKLALGKIKSARDCHPNAVDTLLFEAEEILETELAEQPAQPAQQEPLQNNPFDCGVYLGSGKDYAIKHHVSYGPAQQEPVASIFISGIGEREFDDWGHDLPVGRNLLYTSPPAQRKPLTVWTEAQHERAYRNSPELHKDVKSLAAFKRVAKEIAAMYGIKENT